MAEKKLELQPRLQALADWVKPGARLADIGTDHGYVPVWLRLHGIVDFAIASDLRPLPLEHARRSAVEFGADHIDFRLCDGLAELSPEETDTILIAGMGGETITAILEAAPWALDGRHMLLLQPMSRAEHLRLWLTQNGGKVLRERLVEDKGTIYPILEVVGGEVKPLETAELYGGFALQNDPLWGEYLSRHIAKLRRAAGGLRQSSAETDKSRAEEWEAIALRLEFWKGEWENANCGGN